MRTVRAHEGTPVGSRPTPPPSRGGSARSPTTTETARGARAGQGVHPSVSTTTT